MVVASRETIEFSMGCLQGGASRATTKKKKKVSHVGRANIGSVNSDLLERIADVSPSATERPEHSFKSQDYPATLAFPFKSSFLLGFR